MEDQTEIFLCSPWLWSFLEKTEICKMKEQERNERSDIEKFESKFKK